MLHGLKPVIRSYDGPDDLERTAPMRRDDPCNACRQLVTPEARVSPVVSSGLMRGMTERRRSGCCPGLDRLSCGVTTDLLRWYADLRRARLGDHTPRTQWLTHTVIATRRFDGVSASGVLEGGIDSPSFLAYDEQVMVPPVRPATC